MLFLKKSSSLVNYNLIKKGVTSGGSRLSFTFKRKLPLNIKIPYLITSKRNNAGRAKSGRIVMFTKKSYSGIKRIFSINYTLRLRSIIFTGALIILPFSHKVLSLIFLSCGSILYVQSTTTHKLFNLTRLYRFTKNLFRLKNKLILLNKLFFIEQGFFLINQLPKNQSICLLELLPNSGIKYVRSPGTSAIITKLDRDLSTALVRLPSGVRKVFSLFSIGSVGVNLFPENKH
jgi:hypothetical protein